MPRRNDNDKRIPQHSKGLRRPRGWHRKATSPETKRWLEQQRREAA